MNLQAEIVRTLRDAGVRKGDRVGAAVSGGADSTALLHLLVEVGADEGIALHVVHVDHGLRPESSSDARFVASLADDLGVPWTLLRVAVPQGPGLSLEAEARRVRYHALERAADELGLKRVATAHTLDDQAETVLLRVLRGTGVGGLAGIAPVRGRFVRPLLGVASDELRVFLGDLGIAWREDPTNADLRRERNWVRRAILPQLTSRRPGVTRTLARLADLARADEAYLDGLAREIVDRAATGPGWTLVRAGDLDAPEPLLSRALRHVLRRLDAPRTEAAVAAALEAARGRPGDREPVSAELWAWRLPAGLALLAPTMPAPDPVALPPRGVTLAPAFGVRVRVGEREAAPWTWRGVAPDDCRLELRPRRPGDRVAVPAGTRKVQDVLVDAKVPRPLRPLVPILCAGGRPVAVVGFTTPPVRSTRAPDDRGVAVDVEPERGSLWEATGLWNPQRLRATS